jgi:hypothetical protein
MSGKTAGIRWPIGISQQMKYQMIQYCSANGSIVAAVQQEKNI